MITNSAKELLDDVIAKYAALSSYADQGELRRKLSNENSPHIITFSTLFKKPNFFRFEFHCPHPYKPIKHIIRHHVIGFDGHNAYRTKIGSGAVLETENADSLELAIAGATGISLGSVHTIGKMLFPEITGSPLFDHANSLLNEDRTIEEIPCYSVTTHIQDKQLIKELLIEKESLLIRAITTCRDGHPPSDERRTNIRVGENIDERRFSANA